MVAVLWPENSKAARTTRKSLKRWERRGVRVDQLDDVGPALERAIDDQMTKRQTTVIEVMTTKELGDPFRKDALSRPVRHLKKYAEYT